MKEKELRLALVCYGGVSLAVYMHGVTKEILKLVRASHDRQVIRNGQKHPSRADISDTEDVYGDLLSAFEPHLDLRIVVDIIAGASAGGINGIILGRALSHDLELDPVRSFWLKHTDVTELMTDKVQAKPWHKIPFRPFVWALMWRFRKLLDGDQEFNEKLSIFLRSRWFKPPFDGASLTQILYHGISSMERTASKTRSLLPKGLPLDLFVTVTDFFGYTKTTPIHDPPSVVEHEHRQVIRLRYQKSLQGVELSDFDSNNIPGLAFAARATSSFPGAFPPAKLSECDQLIRDEGIVWKSRVDFLYKNFQAYLNKGHNPAHAAFVDGSVLVNKPFSQAIGAIAGRPAYRQVDRRVLYIDPHPREPRTAVENQTPGFWRTLRGALSDIPRNEPIHEDLAWVNDYNSELHRLQTVIETSRPHISAIVDDVAGDILKGRISGPMIGKLRLAVNAEARAATGFAYEGYVRLKLASVLDDVLAFLSSHCGFREQTDEYERLHSTFLSWADKAGITSSSINFKISNTSETHSGWIRFLLTFDARFRQRRLRFTIRAINQLYSRLDEAEMEGLDATKLDELKAGLHKTMDVIVPMTDTPSALSPHIVEKLKTLLRSACSEELALDGPDERDHTSNTYMDRAISLLGEHLNYEGHAERVEAELAGLLNGLPYQAKKEVLEPYIGFAAWDVLTFAVTNWRDLDEFDEIRVDRLSPDDANSLRPGGTAACLKGQHFNHFGAFFSRGYRENDYLWGRLHAAERLIDIVVNAAQLEKPDIDVDTTGIKRRAFLSILRTEENVLNTCQTLIAELKGAAEVLR